MLTMNILMNSHMKQKLMILHLRDFSLKCLQERFSKHKFILVEFQSLLTTDPSQLPDQVLENCNSLVLIYRNDIRASLTELIVELRLWHRRLARLERDELPKHVISAFQHCKDHTVRNVLVILAIPPASATENERSFSKLRLLKPIWEVLHLRTGLWW